GLVAYRRQLPRGQPRASCALSWDIVADKLSAAGWSWGYCSAVTPDGWRWIVDAHRGGRRYIVHSDELLARKHLLQAEERRYRPEHKQNCAARVRNWRAPKIILYVDESVEHDRRRVVVPLGNRA